MIHHGDCLDVLPTMAADSVDAVVTDPPYHLTSIVKRFGSPTAAAAKGGVYARSSAGFMGKQWDGGDVAFHPATWAAVLRVMRPGGYMVAFASSRGYHRMVCAIEDAGFVIHPMLAWITGQGFPKAHKVEDAAWEGWRYGLQSLKPAVEPICLAQKPMSEKTGTLNVLRWGTGALNIDATRVETDGRPFIVRYPKETNRTCWNASQDGSLVGGSKAAGTTTAGRWPANVVHDGSDEVLAAFGKFGEKTSNSPGQAEGCVSGNEGKATSFRGGVRIHHSDTGTAARFFYAAKASAADRCGSKHPTIKPVSLMRWLAKLICPPGGTVLDPFAGSGTTIQAAMLEGFSTIGIEREAEYVADIQRRLAHMHGGDAPLFAEVAA